MFSKFLFYRWIQPTGFVLHAYYRQHICQWLVYLVTPTHIHTPIQITRKKKKTNSYLGCNSDSSMVNSDKYGTTIRWQAQGVETKNDKTKIRKKMEIEINVLEYFENVGSHFRRQLLLCHHHTTLSRLTSTFDARPSIICQIEINPLRISTPKNSAHTPRFYMLQHCRPPCLHSLRGEYQWYNSLSQRRWVWVWVCVRMGI